MASNDQSSKIHFESNIFPSTYTSAICPKSVTQCPKSQHNRSGGISITLSASDVDFVCLVIAYIIPNRSGTDSSSRRYPEKILAACWATLINIPEALNWRTPVSLA
jgi:hypothetical protein